MSDWAIAVCTLVGALAFIYLEIAVILYVQGGGWACLRRRFRWLRYVSLMRWMDYWEDRGKRAAGRMP